jgi:hypothetical protein
LSRPRREHVPPPPPSQRRPPHLNRKNSLNNATKKPRAKIDRTKYFEQDGELLTDLEVLAKKNAAENERNSAIFYPENEEYIKQPLKPILKKKENRQPVLVEDEDEDKKKEGEEEYKAEIEEIEQVDLSKVMESLTIIDNSPSPFSPVNKEETATMTPPHVSPKDDHLQPLQQETTIMKKKKKHMWPFRCLKNFYDKEKNLYYKELFREINQEIQEQSLITPIMSLSTPSITPSPPVPVLSPDNGSSLYSSSISPFEALQDEEQLLGYWAVKMPPPSIPVMTTPDVWVRLDNENQKKIMKHIKSMTSFFGEKNDTIEFRDSHFFHGQYPISVAPLQKTCFVPTDAALNQIVCLPFAYIPTASQAQQLQQFKI